MHQTKHKLVSEQGNDKNRETFSVNKETSLKF